MTTRTRFTSALVTATTMTGGKRAIKERIVILMKNPKTALITMIAVVLVCALVVGCTFTGSVEDPTEPLTLEEQFEQAGYEQLAGNLSTGSESPWTDVIYHYTGKDSTVELVGLNATLELPADWAGRVIILQAVAEDGSSVAYISSLAQSQAVMDINEGSTSILDNTAWAGFIVRYSAVPKEYDLKGFDLDPEYAFFLDENETHYFYAETIDTQNPEASVALVVRDVMMNGTILSRDDALGGEGYKALIGDLVATPEMAMEMITLHGIDAVRETDASEPAETTQPQLETEPVDPYADYYELLRFPNSNGTRNWLNFALGCEFADPTEVDLARFFYPGIESLRYWENLNNQEDKFLTEQGLGGGFFTTMPVDSVEEIVRNTFGLSLEEFACGIPESWHYFQENDSYYVRYDTSGGELYRYTIEDIIIDRVEVLENDLVQVYYTPNDTSSYLNGQPMVLTLRGNESDGYTAVSNQMVVSEGQLYTTLTLEQVGQVNEVFDAVLYRGDPDKTMVNPLNNFFSCYYNSPAEIDLGDFVWYFCYQYAPGTEEDFNLLAGKYPALENWKSGYNLSRYPADAVDEVLYENTGFHLEDLYGTRDVSTVYYLEETDSYYSFSSDAGWQGFTCAGGRIYDGYVELYSNDAILTLREENGKYYIYSHIPMSWRNPTELTDAQIRQVNEAFEGTLRGEDNIIYQKPISRFFTSYYDCPQEIDLKEFLRNFSAQGIVEDWVQTITEEEFAALARQDDFPYKDEGVTELSQMKRQVNKYTGEAVDAVIYRYTGIHLNELSDAEGRGDALYSKEYDTYYNFVSDVEPGIFNCISGLDYGTYVELYSQDAVLTLREENGRYYIYSHLPIE